MRRPIRVTGWIALIALLLAGCASAEATESEDLLIWADGSSVPPLQEVAAIFTESEGVQIRVQEVGFSDIRGQLLQAGPAGKGPDLILGANDWIGELVTNGAISAVQLPNPDDFNPAAVEAFSWDGKLYGVPYAVENLALYRNTDLVPEAPESMQDIVETSLQLQQDGEVDQAFMIPAAPEEAPYHFHPIVRGFGGYVFAYGNEEGYDTSDVGIDSDGAIAAGEAVQQWVRDGFINPDVSGSIQQERFGAGDVAFAISGPWALVQDGAGFEETGVNFAVDPIPPVDGNLSRPYVGSQGLMISAFSDAPLLAQSFASEVMASFDAQMIMYRAANRPPALTEALDQVSEESPNLAAFAEAAEVGEPLPAVPAMSTVFSAQGDMWTLIFGGAPVTDVLGNTAEIVRNAVDAGQQ
jgi:arabinogalactan oligomer/maltooligosaccharide transport system substrate-binding protein